MSNMDTIEIAGKKYNETKISKEKEEYIRLEAVDLCFALKQLVSDSSWLVRTAVARKKVGHDLLVKDENWRVRATVAKYTDDSSIIDELASDENDFVRFVIVKRGYCLDSFVSDEDEEIASIARYQLQNA
ncbi:MAG: HEAT repeat domain-containing protein [Methylococcaceae bacterium]